MIKVQAITQTVILVDKQQMYLQNQLICSDCGVSTICDLYF
jgi:hypothetical protein